MGAVRMSEPVITLEGWFKGKGIKMPKIIGSKKRAKAKKQLGGPVGTLPEKMTLSDIRKKVANDGKGFTIQEMAEFLGTKKSTYFFWEKGDRPMPDKYRARVEALLVRHTQGRGEESVNGDGGATEVKEAPDTK